MDAVLRSRHLAGFALACSIASAAPAQTNAVRGSPQWFFNQVPASPVTDLTTGAGQQYQQTLHAVGRQDLHAALPEKMLRPAPCAPWPATEGDQRTIAERLAELARDTSIVIINEAHDESRHREVVRQLAIELRKQGYQYFAAETLSELAARRPDEHFARLDAGSYSLEPAFGQLLRTVKELGYELIAYEDTSAAGPPASPAEGVLRREEAQANNLVDRIFRAKPDAKTLIHVGYSHAAEVALNDFGQSIEWMAARLKSKTGIDSLTIDQVRCASLSDTLELASASSTLPPGAHDVSVAHPTTVLFRGRPQWRIDAGAIAVELPETLVSERSRTLIEARHDAEPADTVPLDRVLLWPGERLPLLLQPGAIRIQQYFEDGSSSRTLILNVR